MVKFDPVLLAEGLGIVLMDNGSLEDPENP
jgi:hypothetical protein